MKLPKLLIDGQELEINTLRVRPGDVLIIRAPDTKPDGRRRLTEEATRLFGCKVVVVPGNHQFDVMRRSELEPSDTLVTAGDARYRVFDTNGLEWEDVVECDTATGEMICFDRDEQGRIVPHGGCIRTKRIKVAAPLKLEAVV